MTGRLRPYRENRRFARTPEPPPDAGTKAAKGKLRFVVHKHDATRLHYDLRLEIDGALASWAIPKGPSFDPKVHRLAVETEDHPLAYADFEGRIPSGEYGGGDSLLWDRGTWDTDPPGQGAAQRRKGHLAIELRGEKLRGRWHLIRTGRERQWLLFKGHDEFASTGRDVIRDRPESIVSGRRITRGPVRVSARRASHPSPVDLLLRVWPPMLATTMKHPPHDGADWICEVKYDGYRGLAALSGGRLALQSRNGLDLSQRFPAIVRALTAMDVSEAVVDGEIVALDAKGIGRFETLQEAGERLRYCLFDLLWLDGKDLRPRPLEERRDLLEGLVAPLGPPVALSERLGTTWQEALDEARRRGLEGIIAKRRTSTYEGRRSTAWIKLKLQQSQAAVVVGYTPIGSGEPAIGALLLAVSNGRGGFEYAGKVGTGFSATDREQLWRLLEAERIARPMLASAVPRLRDARWVPPRHVVQVRSTEWTRDGRLRHPVFAGTRDDKRPEECLRETMA